MSPPLTFTLSGRCDQGLVRNNNEDRFVCALPLGLVAVADGMGGQQAGEIAARIVVEGLTLQCGNASAEPDYERAALRLGGWISVLGEQIQAQTRLLPQYHGMGTTLVAGLFLGDHLALAHVGDSRAYLLRDGVLERLTRDHTLAEVMQELGIADVEEEHHHMLVRSVGMPDMPPPDLALLQLYPGDRLLLCSDGLYGCLPDAIIAEVLQSVSSPDEACERLIDLANAQGGPDNITTVIADVARDGPRPVLTAPPIIATEVGASLRKVREPTERAQQSQDPSAPATPVNPPTADRAACAGTSTRTPRPITRCEMSLLCRLGFHKWIALSRSRSQTQSLVCVRCGQRRVPDSAPKRERPAPDRAAVTTHGPATATVPARSSATAPAADANAWRPGQRVLGEFRVERELGRGGMGTVSLVADDQGRRFAVKRTRLASAEMRSQFLRELQVWLDLPAHPHILPLRFVRSQGDEQVLFTDYLSGGSLQDRLGHLALDEILDLAIQYAWGLHALHALGQVHQDVKPGNALLDGDGGLKVADFGLTRARPQGIQPPAPGAAPTATVAATHAGSYTPAYCSPEQAHGRTLTPQTDTWSWGLSVLAMFYGEAPTQTGLAARQALEWLEANGDRIEGVPALPKGVAEVLRRCFREPPAERWPSLLAAAAALVALYPGLCGRPYPRPQPAFVTAAERPELAHDRRAGHVEWDDPRAWLEEALRAEGKDAATAEREAAELAAAQARSRKGMAAGDLVLYDAAYRIFERLVGEGRTELRVHLAALCVQKALVHKYLEDPPGRIGMYDRAIELYERLVEQAGRRELEPALATILMNKAIASHDLGQGEAALALYDRAITLYQRLVEQDGRRELEPDLARALQNKAAALNALGQRAAAVALYDRAIVILEKQERRELEPVLAMAIQNKANALQALGQLEAAVAFFDRAIALYQRLVEQNGQRELEPDLATALMNMATALNNLGQLEKAVALYDRAITLYQRLVEQEGRRELEPDLAMTLQNKATALDAPGGQGAAAVALYDRAIDLYERLVEKEGRRDLELGLATTLMNKANALQGLGQPEASVALYDRAIALYQRLVEQEGRRKLEPDLARALMNKANVVSGLGQGAAAVALYDRAIALYQRLVEQEGRRELEPVLAIAIQNKANALRCLGQLEAAVALYDGASDIYQRLVDKEGRRELIGGWAWVIAFQASTLIQLGQMDQARVKARWAITTLEQEVKRTGRVDLQQVLNWARETLPH